MHARAGQPSESADWIDVERLLAAYVDVRPDPKDPAQRVAFGTSGHRGGALAGSFALVVMTGGYAPVAAANDWFWIVAMGAFGGVAPLLLIGAWEWAALAGLSERGGRLVYTAAALAVGWLVWALGTSGASVATLALVIAAGERGDTIAPSLFT